MDLKTNKEEREEITVEEEELLWEKGLLGDASAECLAHNLLLLWEAGDLTVNRGKLFGLRANEQMLLRFSNIVLNKNFIIFDETISKTFHEGLVDLKRKARLVKHMCHETGVTHLCSVCFVCT